MKSLARVGNNLYVKFEGASDLDRLEIVSTDKNGFEYFRWLGIVDYKRTFKSWLRKFPRPILLAALENEKLLAWVFIEEWSESAKDGEPVYVLRAIETLPELRGKKIGYRLLLLSLQQTIGYIVVKPLNVESKNFFKNIGFMEDMEFKRCPIDLSTRTGYLIFPPYKRKSLLESYHKYFTELV